MNSTISQLPVDSGPRATMTTKEWVIPPRPKPGRKPATDTPPTKRKAQNRAAQRAFRERRAARVGELEEQIEEQREEHERTERDLRETVRTLELEVESFRSKCQVLESLLERERQERKRVESEAETRQRRWSDSAGVGIGSIPGYSLHETQPDGAPNPQIQSPEAGGLRGSQPEHRASSFSITNIISPPDADDFDNTASSNTTCGKCSPDGPCECAQEALAQVAAGCGKCAFGSRCECLEETLRSMPELKRPLASPSLLPGGKRRRADTTVVDSATEIDFTATFAKKSSPSEQQSQYTLSHPMPQSTMATVGQAPKDGCGFCKDGTFCVCAEATLSIAPPAPTMSSYAETPNFSHQIRTPPPSENDVTPLPMEVTTTGAIKLPSLSGSRPLPLPLPAACTNGPGTCAQCLADPKSGLFCRSLAANFDRQQASGSGRSRMADGSCCKQSPQQDTTNHGLSIPCAEAYKTLASHPRFEQASDDIGTWLPKLKATPQLNEAVPSSTTAARAPIEVEIASIMSVLKGFDVRHGTES